MSKTILVTGATGKVGGAVVEALTARSFQVRAATRNPATYQGGALVTPVRLDYHDPATIAPALAGADGLFLIALPLDPKAPEELAPVLEGAKAAGISYVVLHSALGVDQVETAPLRIVERILMASGLPYAILRSNFFMDNFSSGFIAPMIKEKDGIFLAAGEGATSFIATRDIAAVAAAVFELELSGQEYNLTGPEPLDHHQVATLISGVAGRKITYHPLAEADFLAGLRNSGVDEAAVQYLAMLYDAVRAGYTALVSGDVEKVTGRPPLRFADFVAAQAGAWKK